MKFTEYIEEEIENLSNPNKINETELAVNNLTIRRINSKNNNEINTKTFQTSKTK